MLNRSKKKAILEWANCFCSDGPIESIEQLADGYDLYRLSLLISPIGENLPEPDTTDGFYSCIQKCLDEFYRDDITKFVDLKLCKDRNTFQIAMLSMLLLSAVVHVSLTSRETLIQSLTQLDSRVQEDIQECISSVLLADSTSAGIPPNFAAVLSHTAKHKESAGPTPKKLAAVSSTSFQTPKRDTRTRKRGNEVQGMISPQAPSPLKVLLDSPQIRQQVALRELERETSKLRKELHKEQDRSIDFENKARVLEKTLSQKEREIAELKGKVVEYRRYRDVADELSECTLAEKNGEKGQEKVCRNCMFYQESVKNLESTNKELNRELDQRLSNQTFVGAQIGKLEAECRSQRLAMENLQELLSSKESEIARLREEKTSFEQIACVNKAKYEELRDMYNSSMQECPVDLSEGESLSCVPEKQLEEMKILVERLKVDNGRKTALIVSLNKIMEERRIKIEQLESSLSREECSSATLKQNLESIKLQSTILSEENSSMRIRLSSHEQEKSELKETIKNLQEKVRKADQLTVDLEAKLDNLSNKNSSIAIELQELKSKQVGEQDVLKELEVLHKSKEDLEADLLEMRDRNSTLKSELQAVQLKKGDDLVRDLEAIKEENITLISEMKLMKPKLEENEALLLKIDALEKQIAETEAELFKYKDENASLISRLQATQSELELKETSLSLQLLSGAPSSSDLADYEAELTKLREENSTLSSELELVQQELEKVRSCKKNAVELIEQNIEYEKHINKLSESKLQREKDYLAVCEELEMVKGARSQLECESNGLKTAVSSLEAELHTAQQEVEDIKSQMLSTISALQDCVSKSMDGSQQALIAASAQGVEYPEADFAFLVSQIMSMLSEREELKKQNDKLQRDREEQKPARGYNLRHSPGTSRDENVKLNKLLEKKTKEISSLSEELIQARENENSLRSKLEVEKKKYAEVLEIKGNFATQFQENQKELENRGARIRELEDELISITKKYEEKEEALLNQNHLLMERLEQTLEENDNLKKKLKEPDALRRQKRGSSKEMQLFQKEFEQLEKENENLKAKAKDIEKLQAELEEKIVQINQLKVQIEGMSSLEKEKDVLKALMQSKADEASEEISRLRNEYDDQIKCLADENSELKKSCDAQAKVHCDLNHTIELMQEKNSKVECENQTLICRYREYESKCLDLENQLLAVNSQIETLNQSLMQSANENNSLKEEAQAMETRYEERIRELLESLKNSTQEKIEMKQKIEALLVENNLQKHAYENHVNELKQGHAITLNELEEYKFKYNDLNAIHSEHIEGCDLEAKRDEVVHLSTRIYELESSNKELKNRVCVLQDQTEVMQKTIEHLQAESLQMVKGAEEKHAREREHLQSEAFSSSEAEKERLSEKIEDLERRLQSISESKDRTEKEYFLCVEQKDRIIDSIDKAKSELQELLRVKDRQLSEMAEALESRDSEIMNLKEAQPSIEVGDNISKSDEHLALEQKLQVQMTKNRELLVEVAEMKVKLEMAQTELRKSKEEFEKMRRKFKAEMADFTESVSKASAKREMASKERLVQLEKLQNKYEKAKEIIRNRELEKMELEKRLENMNNKMESMHQEMEVLRKQANNVNSMSKDYTFMIAELEHTKKSLDEMTIKLKQSENSITRMRNENGLLSSQLEFASNQLRKLNQQADMKHGYHLSARRFSCSATAKPIGNSPRITSSKLNRPALERLLRRKESTKAASPKGIVISPRKRVSSFSFHPVTKKRGISLDTQPGPSSSSHSTSFSKPKAKSPLLIQRNTSRYSSVRETYLLRKGDSPESQSLHSFNESFVSDGFNHSLMGTRFTCEDEEDFLNHNSLSNLRPMIESTPSSSTKRVSELQRRNTLVPPHMKSSYPVEMQMQPVEKYSDDSIREGRHVKKQLSGDGHDALEACGSSRDAKKHVEISRRRSNDIPPEDLQRKINEPQSSLGGLPLSSLVHTTPSGKAKSALQRSSTPRSIKKILTFARKMNYSVK